MSESPTKYTIDASLSHIRPTTDNVIDQFRAAIIAEGLVPPDVIIADGKLRKFSTNGKKVDKAGWYILRDDEIPSGIFGDFRTGIHKSWRANIGRPLSRSEERGYRARIAAIREIRDAEEQTRRFKGQQQAQRIWSESKPCKKHPYLERKNINPYGIRINRKCLVIPMTLKGEIKSLQFIYMNGNKRFLSGGQVIGCYFMIGNSAKAARSDEFQKDIVNEYADSTAICIAEGFATGATIFEATGFPVAVAFHAGNLAPVARTMRDFFPSLPLVLCADDDVNTRGNPGLTRATEASLSIGGLLAVPNFGTRRQTNYTDFNDMSTAVGLESVRQLITDIVKSAPVEKHDNPEKQSRIAETSSNYETKEYWPEPIPIATELKPVDTFTGNLLPEPLRSWVMDIARRQSTATEFVAVTALTALSAVIGRKVRIYPKRHDDWLVVPNLWAMLIGRPSAGKTPAMREALKPLHLLANNALTRFRKGIKEQQASIKLRELKAKAAEKNAKKAILEGNDTLALQLLSDTVYEPPPTPPRYIVNDATIEKLGELLNQNPNGLLLERDELHGWLRTLEREDRSNDRAFFLEASSGDGTYTYDRIGRGTLHVPALCLSIVGGIQPSRLAPYINHAVRGSSDDDGFIQRFQLAVYPDPPIFTRVDQSPDMDAQSRVYEIFEQLAGITPKQGGCITLRFTEEAQNLFYAWFDQNEHQMRQKDLHPALESHFIKFRSLVPSLALILELVSNPKAKTVGKDAIVTACAWATYLKQHAERIYHSAIDPVPVTALEILKKLQGGKLPNPFVYNDIKRGNWVKLTNKIDVLNALDMLEELGFLRVEAKTQRTGRMSKCYNVHPSVFMEAIS